MGRHGWTVPLFRIAGIAVGMHWTLIAWLAWDCWRFAGHDPLLWPVFAVALWTSVLLHEFGHALAARSLGGDCREIELWALGGLSYTSAPMRPWPQFATAAAGPVVNAIIAAAAYGFLHLDETRGIFSATPVMRVVVPYLAWVNLRMTVFNILPIATFDGGQMFRALLWPIIGLPRATIVTLYLGYPAALGMIWYGAAQSDTPFMALGTWLIFRIVQEHTLLRLGQGEQDAWSAAPHVARDGWLTRWRRERARRADERREREEQAEQEVIDRLLAKVGESGLPSLTRQERATLEAFSKKQRERQEVAGRR